MNMNNLILTILFLLTSLCFQASAMLPPPESSSSIIESTLSFRRFTTLDGLPQMQTEMVWQDEEGYIYIGTLSGFVRYDGLAFTPFLRGRRENIVAFEQVGGKTRALGFVRQWSIDGKDVTQIPIDKEGELLLNNFNSPDLPPGFVLLEDKEEKNRALYTVQEDEMRQVAQFPVFDEMTPDRKLFMHGDAIYVPTPKGLYRILKRRVEKISDKDDVFALQASGDTLQAFAADGIYRIVADSLLQICAHEFEAPDYGLMVRPFRDGKLIIADSHTIWLYDSRDTVAMHQLATGFNMIKGIMVDKWSRLWAATYQGAYCFFHCNFVNHRLTDRNDIVRAIAACNGRLVMGTLNGKVIVDGKEISNNNDNFYGPSAAVVSDKVYLTGNGDVEEVAGETVRRLGLPDDRYQFVARYADRLIIGTRGSVLSYQPTSSQVDTLIANIKRPWCAADDGKGNLWVAANPGLFRVDGVTDGTPSVEQVKNTPQSQVITTIASDGKGSVCFAVGDTLFAIINGNMRVMDEAAPLLSEHEIRTVHLTRNGHLIAAAIDGIMVARLNDAGIATDMHWFDALNGFTTIDPQMATIAEEDDGTVWLTGLEDMVSFSPEALLTDNQQSTVIQEPQSIFKKWWVWLIITAVLSLVIWCITRRFEKRKAQKKMAKLEREKRQKELQMSAVRLKSIPHFHSNVLASIEYFVMNNSSDEAIHYMSLYSDFTNRTLSDIDRPARSVGEEVDYVQTYLELERLRYGDRLQYTITVDPDVDRKIMIPTMLLHTYCQNAVKHGIAAKHGIGSVEVSIKRMKKDECEGVLVTVSDDGVGRTEAAQSKEFSTKQGLKILQQQIELYNRDAKHKIEQRVTDLTDDSGRPAGTRFEIWIPADYRF